MKQLNKEEANKRLGDVIVKYFKLENYLPIIKDDDFNQERTDCCIAYLSRLLDGLKAENVCDRYKIVCLNGFADITLFQDEGGLSTPLTNAYFLLEPKYHYTEDIDDLDELKKELRAFELAYEWKCNGVEGSYEDVLNQARESVLGWEQAEVVDE